MQNSTYIALCIMCKNDEKALIENIEYHSLIGVDHFIIYDNISDNPLKNVLSERSNVTIIDWLDQDFESQVRCYNDCIEKFRTKFRWIGFIDTDEFIVIKDGSTDIKNFLKPYEEFGGVGINWKCFGSSGHITKQDSIINNYLHSKNIHRNKNFKSIVNPMTIDFITNPHFFFYIDGYYCVNELKQKIEGHFNIPITQQKIQLNHYVTRSREDFEYKKIRGGGNTRKNDKLTEEFWNEFQDGDLDLSIINYINYKKNKPKKIFQIGFNRCGTGSLYKWFEKNNIPSVHWKSGALAKKMLSNYNLNLPILTDIDEYQFYSDMEFVDYNQIIEGYRFYKELDIQNPNSLFILNTRNKTNWINSRLQHPAGHGNYIKRYSSCLNINENDVINLWSNDWDTHISSVREYFKDCDRFIEFNIEEDDSRNLVNFLNYHGINIQDDEITKINNSK